MASVRLIESKLLARGRDQVIVARAIANLPPFVPFYVLVTNVSKRPVHLPKKVALACGMESSTLLEQPSGPSKPMNDEFRVDAVNKPSKSIEVQTLNLKEVKKSIEERLKQN